MADCLVLVFVIGLWLGIFGVIDLPYYDRYEQWVERKFFSK